MRNFSTSQEVSFIGLPKFNCNDVKRNAFCPRDYNAGWTFKSFFLCTCWLHILTGVHLPYLDELVASVTIVQSPLSRPTPNISIWGLRLICCFSHIYIYIFTVISIWVSERNFLGSARLALRLLPLVRYVPGAPYTPYSYSIVYIYIYNETLDAWM